MTAVRVHVCDRERMGRWLLHGSGYEERLVDCSFLALAILDQQTPRPTGRCVADSDERDHLSLRRIVMGSFDRDIGVKLNRKRQLYE